MKKIFKGVTYLLLLVLIFVYLCTTGNVTVFRAADFTGIPTIGMLFLFPAFVMVILALCINNKIVRFLSEMFSLFTGVFALASGIIAMFKIPFEECWPAILLILFALGLTVFTAISVFQLISDEKKVD